MCRDISTKQREAELHATAPFAPRIMGIINLSRNSFYNPQTNLSDALFKAEKMAQDGATIIDVGAIATNPTINLETQTPAEQQELDLLIPFIEKLSRSIDISISVDTYRANVMRASINAGANMINDQHALTEENALETAVKLNVPVCLMHHFKRGSGVGDRGSVKIKRDPKKLLSGIVDDLRQYVTRCVSAGMHRENIILDPGFGGGHFGKTPAENFYILENLKSIVDLGFPVLVGVSRKSMFGGNVEDRLPQSLEAALFAAKQGAAIIRVHDVKETVAAFQHPDQDENNDHQRT